MWTLKALPHIFFMVTLQSSMILSNFYELEWTTSGSLSVWYSALDMCLLSSSSTKEVEEILSDCRKLHLKEANDQPVRCTLGNSWPSKSGFCSSSDIPYALRKNFRNAVKGFDDPSSHPLQEFFGELSKRKSSVILIGDSVMQQFFSALACELEREGMWKDPSQFKNTDEIRLVPGYRPEDPAVPIKFTPIYHFVNGRYDRVANASMVAMKKSIDDFVQSYKSVVIIVNMGLHYVSNPIAQFSRIDYIEQMTAALRYLHSVSLHSKGVKVYWRETTAQHFPTPNGYWPGVRYAASMKVGCTPINDTSPGADWRNEDIYDIINKNNLHTIGVIPYYNLTLPLWNMHVNGHMRDCTHFCWTPMLYQPIFHFLAEEAKKFDFVVNR